MHQSSYNKMAQFVEKYLTPVKNKKLIVLDIGSFDVNGSYKPLFSIHGWNYIGIDTNPGKNVDIVISDPYSWKNIPSNYADVVVSGQAFEHIEYIWLTMKEISRVLKPQGLICVIAPSSGPEHKHPTDCWRIYPDGFKALAKYSELEIVEVFTQWENENHADDSNIWHDSVLICRKPGKRVYGLNHTLIWLKNLLEKFFGICL
jgi:SAM-dependent methyltransferase